MGLRQHTQHSRIKCEVAEKRDICNLVLSGKKKGKQRQKQRRIKRGEGKEKKQFTSANMARLDEFKPVLAMVFVQFISALMAVFTKAALTVGLRPMIFVVYRQAIAALILVPTSILSKGRSITHLALGCNGFWMVFVSALVGFTMNECFYYQGLERTTSSMSVAMVNLLPALTFVMAASIGLEKLNLRSTRSMAKIFGTIICVGGAISMGLLKGQKLIGMEDPTIATVDLHSLSDKWVMGFFFLLGSIFCWSLWLILQVPICKRLHDPLSVTTWTCFLSAFQSSIVAFFLQSDLGAWKITSVFQLLCCLYAATFGTVVNFYLQTWCIAARGPLFCALFNPLSTVITTILASIFLQEELYLGSLLGAVAVVSGLYMVLWGKAEDLESNYVNSTQVVLVDDLMSLIDEPQHVSEVHMKEPLLPEIKE